MNYFGISTIFVSLRSSTNYFLLKMVCRFINMGLTMHSMLNSELRHLSNVTFSIILFSYLLIDKTVQADPSEVRSQSYRLAEDETGARVCARSSPYIRVSSVRSPISCSSQCSLDADCSQFNFRSGEQVCELFNRSVVTLALTSDDAVDCVHYVNNMESCLYLLFNSFDDFVLGTIVLFIRNIWRRRPRKGWLPNLDF